MMEFFLYVVGGILIGIAYIYVAREWNEYERPLFGYSLLLAAFWYVGFGFFEALPIAELLPQVIAGLAFIALAVLGLRKSLMYLGVGWLAHGVWDIASYLLTDVTYAPSFTAPICLGFDILAGTYLIFRARDSFPVQPTKSAA